METDGKKSSFTLARIADGKHWYAIPLILTVLFYCLNFFMLATLKPSQEAIPPNFPTAYYYYEASDANPSWDVFLSNWDAQWYESIAEQGYPQKLPLDTDGDVERNQWAFYPLFPLLVKALMILTGLSFGLAALALNLTASALALCLLFRFIANHVKSSTVALSAVASVLLWPSSGVFVLAYTEGITLLLLAVFFTLLTKRNYAGVAAVVLALTLTRALGPALTLFLFAFAAALSFQHGPRTPKVKAWLLVGCSSLCTTLWPLIAGIKTGDPEAFTKTYKAWFEGNTTYFEWFTLGQAYDFGWGSLTYPLIIPLGTFLLIAVCTLSTPARIFPWELRLWSWTYALYIFSVTSPHASHIRYLMLALILIPPFWLGQGSKNRTWAWSAVWLCLVLISIIAHYDWFYTHWLIAFNDPNTGLVP